MNPFEGSVVVSGGRIAAVGTNLAIPADLRVIDGAGKTLIPGLFDLHTHLPYAPVSGFSGGWAKHLAAYLYCGVTSVVDFGSYPEMFAPMRRLINEGAVRGPRIHFAARIAPPYGHGLEGGRGDYFTAAVLEPRDAKPAIDALLASKPDAVKIFTDGWRYGYAPPMASMTREAIAAVVEQAHLHGLEVLTHTVTVQGAKDAAAAGVDVIAHGVGDGPIDAELVELLRGNNVTYAPTLAVYQPKGRDILDPLLAATLEPAARQRMNPPLEPPNDSSSLVGDYPDPGTPRAKRWRALVENNRALAEADVTFGVGTDAGVTNAWHGWATLRELRLLVHGGLTPLEALTAATGQSAAALGVDGERGRIEPGKAADFVLIDGDPHREIADVAKIERVFLGGEEVDRDALAALIATEHDAPLPTRGVQPLLDDFELDARKSRLGTNWVNGSDPGLSRARMMLQKTLRRRGDHALTMLARMPNEENAWAAAHLPLTPGGVEPADLSEYEGLRCQVRGEGDYVLMISSRSVRNYDFHRATFSADGRWTQVKIPFQSLRQARGSSVWEGSDAQVLMFRIERGPGESAWLEIDDLEFYR